MKNSRDLALVIIFAVLNFTIMLITNQITNLIYMIGLSYVFTILYAINASVAWLMYEGRRWRILAQAILFNTLASLFIPTMTIPLAIAAIIHALTADLIFNSFYGYFKTKNRLLWWIILLQIFFWATQPFWILIFLASLVYPLESVLKVFFIPTMTIGLPIMMISAIAGAIIGHRIFRRVENIY
jgi:hypothetical protein